MAGKSTQNRTQALPDIPSEAIIEAAKSFETCHVRVTRQNSQKQWQTILNGDEMPVMELLNIDKYLDQLTGGGRYRIEAKNPSGVAPLYVVTPFFVHVEGQPRPKPGAGQVTAAPGAAPVAPNYGGGFTGFQTASPSYQPTGWAAGLPPQQAQQYAAMQGMGPGWTPPWRQRGAPNQSFASDQLAMRQVADMKEIVGKLEGELKAERERREARERELENQRRADREKYERDIAEARRREEEERRRIADQQRADERLQMQNQMAQMQANFQQQMQAMMAQMNKPVAPPPNPLADLAPLLMTYLTSSGNRASEESRRQFEMMQFQAAQQSQQQQMMITMLQGAKDGDKHYISLLKEMMEQKSPETQAALMNAMLEMQVTTAGAMANLVKETMPEDPPVWLQAVMGGLGTVQNIANDMIDESRNRRGQPPQQAGYLQQAQHAQLPPGQPQALATVEVPGQQAMVTPPPSAAPAEAQGLDQATQQKLAKAAQQVDSMAMMLPEDYRTKEWRAILIELHAEMPVERVAHLLTRHLSHLMEFRGLPAGFEEFAARPEGTLADILQYLPISSSAPDYARAVIEQTVVFLTEEGYLPKDEPPRNALQELPEEPAPEGRDEGNGTAAKADGVEVEPPPDLGNVEVLPISAGA